MKNSDYKFSRPYITSMTYEENSGFKFEEGQAIDINTSIKPQIVYDEKKEAQKASVSLNVVVGDKSNKAPFYISLTMQATFSWENQEAEDVKNFLRINAPALLVGYARPLIAYMTTNSKYPPFHLSFINFTEKEEQDNKE